MDRKEVLDTLRRNMPILEERFGVTELALFGSFARDQATEESDVDIIVKFNARPHWKTYFGAQFYLEDLLGRPVDMSTMRELRSEILPYVERDTVNVLRPERYPLLAFLHRRYLEFGEKVLSYTDGLDEAAFIADGLTYDATMRNIQLIGESATHIPSGSWLSAGRPSGPMVNNPRRDSNAPAPIAAAVGRPPAGVALTPAPVLADKQRQALQRLGDVFLGVGVG